MYSVFIADDEPKIRKGLSRLISNSDLPLEVCGEAEEGVTAIKLIKELEPDLILLDICMPIKSGMDIIREIKDQMIGSKIIIISGHDEFEYAKEALEMNVFRYLLKPVLAEELEATISAAITALESEKESSHLFEWAIDQLEKRRSYLLESFLLDVLKGNLSEEEIEEQMKYYKITMPSPRVLLLCRIHQESTRFLTEREYQVRKYSIGSIIKDCIQQEEAYVFNDDYSNVVGIFQCDGQDIKSLERKIEKEIVEVIHAKVKVDIRQVDGCMHSSYYELLDLDRTQVYVPIVETIKSFINDQYKDDYLNLTLVSEKFNLSSTYLSRLLKQETGLSFVEYVTQVRLNNAIMLMKNIDLSINEISCQVGFKTQHYFSTVFKKSLGIAPSEYRQRFDRKY